MQQSSGNVPTSTHLDRLDVKNDMESPTQRTVCSGEGAAVSQ